MHLADNSLVFSDQTVQLPLQFFDGAIYIYCWFLGCSKSKSCYNSGNAFPTYIQPQY